MQCTALVEYCNDESFYTVLDYCKTVLRWDGGIPYGYRLVIVELCGITRAVWSGEQAVLPRERAVGALLCRVLNASCTAQ